MRSETVKAGCTVALLGAALLAGAYASGWLTLKLLGVSVPLKMFTYYDYVRALDLPQVAPYVKKIKLAGAIGFGVPLLAWLSLLIPLLRPREDAFHGVRWSQVAAATFLTAGTISACAQIPIAKQENHSPMELSGEWSVKWCDKNNPTADCGGFNVYLVRDGDQVCGNYFGARSSLSQIDEGSGRTISGTARGGEAEITIESSRSNAAYVVRASVRDDVMTWRVIRTIREGNGDTDLIAYDEILHRNPDVSGQYRKVVGECGQGSPK